MDHTFFLIMFCRWVKNQRAVWLLVKPLVAAVPGMPWLPGCPTRELFGRTHGERWPSKTGIQPWITIVIIVHPIVFHQ